MNYRLLAMAVVWGAMALPSAAQHRNVESIWAVE